MSTVKPIKFFTSKKLTLIHNVKHKDTENHIKMAMCVQNDGNLERNSASLTQWNQWMENK